MTLALLIMAVTGAWAQSTYTITFAANNNTVTVENVTLPKTFLCSYDNADGELDLILKELYGWTGDKDHTFCDGETTPKSFDENKVVAGNDNGDHYITINNVFEGTVTIEGSYCINTLATDYSLEISIAPAAPAEWPLTSQDGKQWTLAKMPANDVELQVEYYDPILTLAANNSEWGTASVVYPDLKTKVTKYNFLGGTDGYNVNEAPSKLFDGNTGTKWCGEGKNSYVEFSTDNAIRVVSYVLTTANDNESNPGRNPKSWLLKGKLDENDEWKIIATVNNDTKMKNVNYTPYEFDVDKPGTYKYFRFEIKETTGSNVLQMSEMNLLKSEINGVIDNGDGTYNVKSGTQLDIKAIPAEGYHVASWSNDYEVSDPNGAIQTISVNEDKTITAIFAENEYDITFSEGTNPDPENPEWTATPNPAKTKQAVTVKYNGAKKVIGVKAEKKVEGPALKTINIGGTMLKYADGETWGEAITNHATENTGWNINTVVDDTGYQFFFVRYNENRVYCGSAAVQKDDPIDANKSYEF